MAMAGAERFDVALDDATRPVRFMGAARLTASTTIADATRQPAMARHHLCTITRTRRDHGRGGGQNTS